MRSSAAIWAFLLIHFMNIGVQYCEAWYGYYEYDEIELSTPAECARQCQNGEQPKHCYYHFVIEFYTSNGQACDFCQTPVNTSFVELTPCECVIGDGYEKTILSINRTIPGPSIQVCLGDYIIVDLENAAEGLEASLHWHGIFQNGYQYYDGVPYLTQCPVLSANTFRYQFAVENSGTHFYHSHISTFMMDGLYGSLIVRDPPRTNPHLRMYNEDRPEHVVLISDLFHEFSLERFPGRFRERVGQFPDNFLINGRGNWTNSTTSTNVSPAMFIVERGKRYRMRIINACGTVCLIEVAFEGHPLQVIATDGENIEPFTVDKLTMSSGERIDIVLNANQTSRNYWIHVRGLGECQEIALYQLAVLAYQGTSTSSLSPRPGYFFDGPGNVYNPPNSTECESNVCVDNTCKIYLEGEKPTPLDASADRTIVLSFEFFNYSRSLQSLAILFDRNPAEEFPRFFVAPGGSHVDAMMRNISYRDPPGPPISQDEYDFMCGDRNTPTRCTEPCTCTHVFHIPLGSLIDVMIYDQQPLLELNHPFHLHGYSFCVLHSDQFNGATNKNYITEQDVNRELRAHETRLRNNEYRCCSAKDTVIVPNTGYVILRFNANNPGWWFFHCHFVWHTATGMNVAFHVGQQNDLPPIPPDFPECYNWTIPIQ